DPLGTVVTMLATPFGRLDGLAIDTAGAGGWRPTGSPPDSTSEGVIDGLPGSVSFPRRKVVVDGPPWGKIVGQRSPDTAIAVAVEDGINHRPHLGLAWPPTDAGRRQEGLQDSPLLACQITGVWLWVHTLSTFETPFWNRLSDPRTNPIPTHVRRFLEGWRVYHDVHVERGSTMRSPATTQYAKLVEPDGSNLVSVLHTLYTTDRAFKQQVSEGMRAGFGDQFEELVFQPAAAQHSVHD